MKKSILIALILFLLLNHQAVSVPVRTGFESIPGEPKIKMDRAGSGRLSFIPLSGKSAIDGKFGTANQIGAGVNIHFVTGHEKDLDMIAEAGFKYIRMDFGWQSTERTKGIYNWSAFDELTSNLDKRGIRALYILDYSNTLYEESIVVKNPVTGKDQKVVLSPQHPESIAAFAQWASAAAEHFKGRNIIWEIWNEPNGRTFWRPKPDITQYTALALSTCKAIKAIDPGAVIIAPGTEGIPIQYIEPFLASGVLGYLDAVSVHPYRNYSKSPETASADYGKLRELINRYAPSGKSKIPIICSEWGYSSATKDVSQETQADYIVRMQLSNLLEGIPFSIWYDWKNDGPDSSGHEQNFGTVFVDLKLKPAYSAIKTLNAELKGFTLSRRIDLKNNNDFALLFKDDKGNYKISIWTMDNAHSVMLENKIQKISRATSTDGNGKTFKLRTEQGKLVLDLNKLPKYITLPPGIRME